MSSHPAILAGVALGAVLGLITGVLIAKFGLPDFIGSQLLAYRTDIFEEKQLTPPESWTELLAVCEALAGNDEYAPISFPAKKGGTLASVYSAFLVSNGGWYLNDDGTPNTAHSLNPVPFVYVTANKNAKVENGVLADVAPSILHIMGMPQPADMTGNDLIKD